jgi:hypothetical protein
MKISTGELEAHTLAERRIILKTEAPSKSSRFLHYFQYLTLSLVLCVCLEIVVCPFDFSLLATVLSVLRFTDSDSPLVSSNSSYCLLELLFLILYGVPLMDQDKKTHSGCIVKQ